MHAGVMGWSLIALMAVASVIMACGTGDDEGTSTPPASDDEFVRSACVAMGEWAAHLPELQALGTRLTPKDTLPLFDAFLARLESTRAVELEDFRTAWIDRTKDNVDKIKRGQTAPAWDPMETLPAIAEDDQALLNQLQAELPECQAIFAVPSPTPGVANPTPTTRPGAFLFPVSIDYGTPDLYLAGGPQSTFTAENAAAVKAELGSVSNDHGGVGAVFRWMMGTFKGEPTGGKDIGKTDVNSMLASRTVTGCHDSALMMSAVLRMYGIPAVMVDTAGIQWAEDFAAGKAQGDVGHVMAEAYVGGRWILVDCTSGLYVQDYDPQSPVIAPGSSPGMDPEGFYVLYKGTDPASYGVTSGDVLHQRFIQFSQAIGGMELQMTSYAWQRLP
jgi:hypothetical protein